MNEAEYLKLADVEDRMWYFRALHGHVRRVLDARVKGSAAILDAGCGTGGLMRRLAPEHPERRWTGVDSSPIAVALSRKRCAPSVEVREARVESLPFSDATFDAVVSVDVIYHVDDDAGALREFVRVLRPGGVVIVNVPAYRWLWSYHDEAVHSKRRYSKSELSGKMRGAGLVEIQATYTAMLPFPLVAVRRKLLPAPRAGSDVRLFSPPVEVMFNAMMALERQWFQLGGRLPFGSSVFAVGTKPMPV